MNKLVVYFEIDGFGIDENNNPCPIGMKLELGESETPVPYEELTKNLSIPSFLEFVGFQDVIKPEMVRVISPEKYKKEYQTDESD